MQHECERPPFGLGPFAAGSAENLRAADPVLLEKRLIGPATGPTWSNIAFVN